MQGGLELMGFSADGKYLAFTRTALEDGAGFMVCQVGIVDVATNTWAHELFYSNAGDKPDGDPRLSTAGRRSRWVG